MKTRRTERGSRRAALFLLGAAACATVWGKAFDLDTLAALLAQRKGAEARFTEERWVSGFDGPLRASGTLSFTAPDRFARHTLEPRPESMIVEGNNLTLKRGGRSRQMALDAIPELTALIEAVRGTLNGDVATLQKHFNTRVEGDSALWTLTLTPRESRLAAQVRELKIAGQGADLRSVELWLAGGDHSLMLVEPLPR
jgi:outer membrane lipoprotein-sorting protein